MKRDIEIREEEKFPVAEDDLYNRLDLSQKFHWSLFAVMLRALKEKYGEEALEVCFDAIRNWEGLKDIVEKCGISPRTGTIKQMGPPFTHVDNLCFVFEKQPTVAEHSDKHARFHVNSCNVSEALSEIFPHTCSVISRAIEQGIVEAVNPNLKVSGCRYISAGDDFCDITVTMKKLPQTATDYSMREL